MIPVYIAVVFLFFGRKPIKRSTLIALRTIPRLPACLRQSTCTYVRFSIQCFFRSRTHTRSRCAWWDEDETEKKASSGGSEIHLGRTIVKGSLWRKREKLWAISGSPTLGAVASHRSWRWNGCVIFGGELLRFIHGKQWKSMVIKITANGTSVQTNHQKKFDIIRHRWVFSLRHEMLGRSLVSRS